MLIQFDDPVKSEAEAIDKITKGDPFRLPGYSSSYYTFLDAILLQFDSLEVINPMYNLRFSMDIKPYQMDRMNHKTVNKFTTIHQN